jgi:hypothetical protein
MDNLQQRNNPDAKRINVHEVHEVRYWTRTLGVDEHDLRNAVQAVGTSADKVREYLQKKH